MNQEPTNDTATVADHDGTQIAYSRASRRSASLRCFYTHSSDLRAGLRDQPRRELVQPSTSRRLVGPAR